MSTLTKDVAYAVRMLAKSPGFTLAAILSLAIGIGANTSIFSIIDALLLRPLPYKDADRLVILWNRSPGLNITEDWFSTAQYFDIKNGHHGFEQVAIAIGGNYNLTGRGEPERVGTIRVSSSLLPMLGQSSRSGRLFTPDEDSPGRPPPPCSATECGHATTAPTRTCSASRSHQWSPLRGGRDHAAELFPCREKSCPLSTEPSRPTSFCPCRSPLMPRKTAITKTTTSSANSSVAFPSAQAQAEMDTHHGALAPRLSAKSIRRMAA